MRHKIFNIQFANLEKEFKMKCKWLAAPALLAGLILFASIGFGAQDDSNPSAFYPQIHHKFSPVLDGASVVHDFIIQNKGTATLKIERVKTG